jgi:hypothetical protein
MHIKDKWKSSIDKGTTIAKVIQKGKKIKIKGSKLNYKKNTIREKKNNTH